MAVLVDAHNLLFIGNKRTGSTAIGRALQHQLGGRYVPEKVIHIDGERISKRHATLAELERADLISNTMDLLKFVVVRNPFDSLVSMWAKRLTKPRFATSRVARLQLDFPSWIREEFEAKPASSMHQEFVKGVDVVLQYEYLSSELDTLFRQAGIAPIEIPRANTTAQRNADYQRYYLPETRSIVERVFGDDLDRFGYGF